MSFVLEPTCMLNGTNIILQMSVDLNEKKVALRNKAESEMKHQENNALLAKQ